MPMMKRVWLLAAVLACASKESPPPHTEVAPPPSASATSDDEKVERHATGIGLGYLPPDASVWGTSDGLGAGNGHLDGGNGRIAPEIVQRIVRASFGQTNICYERALKKTPSLTGRVSTRFVIDLDGNVTSASPEASGTTLPDAQAVDCVIAVFRTLHFPKPDGGIVNVVYPLIFSPGDD